MEATFRASMNWLHTWAGVVVGGLLFAIFWMGSLAVFDREIDLWMAPMTRLQEPMAGASIDALRPALEEAAASKAAALTVLLPTERQPVMRVGWREQSGPVQRYHHPATGERLPDPGTSAGTRFIYPFHVSLHISFGQIGVWLVGLAGMSMLVLCVSGVVVHRKIIVDFFSLRTGRKPRRLILDLHDVSGVLVLPFHFLITLSGLVIFFAIYFPATWRIAYDGSRQAFLADAYGTMHESRSGRPGTTAPLDAMVEEARRFWNGAPPRYVIVRNPGDARSIVQMGPLAEATVSTIHDVVYFDGTTGALISHHTGTPPFMSVLRFIAGLHYIQFRHWTLRWMYFGLGLLGCVLIATGYLFWLESRRRKHAQLGLRGVWFVEGLTIGSATGIVIATLAFFVVNRLLPLQTTFLGLERAALEVWTFYLVWITTFAHAWVRPGPAWAEQCWTMAVFAVGAVLLNWITTGDHLIRSLSLRHLWPIAGMDVLLLAGALLAALAARKLRHRPCCSARAPCPGEGRRLAGGAE
jgi:uncharacterized iron-regulated membrane protein